MTIPIDTLYPNWPRDYETPACNLCGETKTRELIPGARGTRMSLVECTSCGFRFFSPRPTWESFRAYLGGHEDMRGEAQRCYDWCSFVPVPDVTVQKANVQAYYGAMLDDVERVLGHVPTSMFEIAGGVGWFSVAAANRGVKTIHGIDLNPFATEICRKWQGLPDIESGDFLLYEPKRRYELVVALDYFEHTYNPRQDLAKIHSMLEPGGALLVKTFMDECDVNHEQLAPPTHAIHWTTPVFRRELSCAGLSLVQWRKDYGGYFFIIIARKPER